MKREHTLTGLQPIVVPDGALDGINLQALAQPGAFWALGNAPPFATRMYPRGFKCRAHLTWSRDLGQRMSPAQWRERARWMRAYEENMSSHPYVPQHRPLTEHEWWSLRRAAAHQWERQHRGQP